jgi:hypothetical protein
MRLENGDSATKPNSYPIRCTSKSSKGKVILTPEINVQVHQFDSMTSENKVSTTISTPENCPTSNVAPTGSSNETVL